MTPVVSDSDFELHVGDALEVLAGMRAGAAHACVTSPPYLDARPEYPSPNHSDWYAIFKELRRVVTGPALFNVGRLWRDGREVLWWVDLVRIAESADWLLLDTLTWIKPNGNPIQGKVFANRHEYVLILGDRETKLNVDAVRVPYSPDSIRRLKRGWSNHIGVKNDIRNNKTRSSEPHPLGGRPPSYVEVHTGREKGNPHPAPMPERLAEHLVSLASWPGQTVLDPFAGSCTTAVAARRHGRRSIAIELSPEYARIGAERMAQQSLAGEELVA